MTDLASVTAPGRQSPTRVGASTSRIVCVRWDRSNFYDTLQSGTSRIEYWSGPHLRGPLRSCTHRTVHSSESRARVSYGSEGISGLVTCRLTRGHHRAARILHQRAPIHRRPRREKASPRPNAIRGKRDADRKVLLFGGARHRIRNEQTGAHAVYNHPRLDPASSLRHVIKLPYNLRSARALREARVPPLARHLSPAGSGRRRPRLDRRA